ncbi:MAG: hypothetical protein Ct9H90mP3_8570 [Flammeovirgaceae bacterium]|nr:MAG: hypothetical protein Ct9H90mP3_8570 [Flammeovirgaceae bacterium]
MAHKIIKNHHYLVFLKAKFDNDNWSGKTILKTFIFYKRGW